VSDSSATSYDVHAEARGSHWIAWLSRGGSSSPERAIVFVAETREKAEANARQFAGQTRY
jgi:hypothetical protein